MYDDTIEFEHKLPSKEIDIYDAPVEWADEECELMHDDAYINFSVEIDARSYGIKSINTYVRKIAMTIGDKDYVFEDDDDWSIEVESDLSNGGMVIPDRIEIDYKQKIITTYFS